MLRRGIANDRYTVDTGLAHGILPANDTPVLYAARLTGWKWTIEGAESG
jgi:hypothetical protein